MNVICVGAGWVGVTTMAVMAGHCPDVQFHIYDIDVGRLRQWNTSKTDHPDLPIYEPGLLEALQSCNNLYFTNNPQVMKQADMIFIAVDTNLKSYGMNQGKQYDLTNFYNVAKEISRQVDPLKQVIVIEKSTVPVKTGEILQSVLPGAIVLSNPEFPTIRSSPLISLPQNYQKLR